MSKGIFITGTDTDVGKTVATYVLGLLLKNQGIDVGVIKPVQCAGTDAEFLTNALDLKDDFKDINPYYADEPLSPHIAFERAGIKVDIPTILKAYQRISSNHKVTLVEGAGGLLVPIKENYLVVDLIKDLELDVVIVSRLGLGTINHTLLTINQAREYGLNVRGVIFNQTTQKVGVPEETNPEIIKKVGKVNIIGTIPFIKDLSDKTTIIEQTQKVFNLKPITYLSKSKTKQYQDDDKKYLWHPFTQMSDWLGEDPLVIERAQGNYLIDTDGKKYLDGVSSLWVNVHGHDHPVLNRAIKDQVNRLNHSTLLGLSNAPAVDLAKKLVEITPQGLEKVFYSDNGSTSVEIAIKIAYQYWQNIGKTKKTDIVHLANSYHGDTLGSVSVGGIDLFHKVYKNLIFKTTKMDFPDCYRAPEGQTYPQYAFECLENFKQTLESKKDSIAAMVVEPIVQGAAGMIMWPKGILKEMARMCKDNDVIFIVDEVATGFGRTGTMFACEQEDVRPDIMCVAKGITGGYLPLAATLTTKKIFDGFVADYKDLKTFFHGHTYTGNPLCCVAALANLQVFEKERVLDKLQPKIKYLQKNLKMFYNLNSVGDIRQRGFMVGIELVKNKNTKEPFDWQEKIGVRVCENLRKSGIILRPLGNVIVLMPPLSITQSELKYLLDNLYKTIESVTELKGETYAIA